MPSSNAVIEIAAIVAVPVIALATIFVGWRDQRGIWWVIVRVALTVYVGMIVVNAFFPLPWWDPAPDMGEWPALHPWPWPWANIVPLATISEAVGRDLSWTQARFMLANILAFAPIGVLVGLLRPRDHGWRLAIAVGLAASLAIETAQLIQSLLIGFPWRVFDVDDLLLNTLGVALGYGAFVVIDRLARAALPARLVFWGDPRLRSAP